MFSKIPPRGGDIIEIKRRWYSHFGIYSGSDRMIHYSSHISKSGDLSVIGKVTEDRIFDVAGGSDIFINNVHDSYLPVYEPDEILNRAKDRLGESNYNLYSQNCEHLANEIRYGDSLSSQISAPPWQPDEDIAEHYKIPMIFDESPKDNDNQGRYETKPPIKTVGVESKREQWDKIKNRYDNETLLNSCPWLCFPVDTQQNVSISCLDNPFKQFCQEYTQEDQSSTWWNRSCKKILLEDEKHDQSSTWWNWSCKKILLEDAKHDQSSTWWNRSCKKILLEDVQHDLCAMLRDKLCMDNLYHNVSFPWFNQSCNGFSLSGTQQNSSMMFMDDLCMVDPDHYLSKEWSKVDLQHYLSKEWSKVDLQHNSSMMFMDDLCMVDPDHDLSKKLRVHPWTVDLQLKSKKGILESGSWKTAAPVCLFIVFGVSALKLICFGFDLLGEKLRPQREQRRRQTDQQEKDDIYSTENIGNIDTILHENVIHV